MKQNQMKRRPRPRTNGRHTGGHNRNHNSDGNRLDPKMRNHARQMLDKYKSMARDAQQSNDRVQAEYYFQHAEHYQRIMNEFEEQNREREEQRAQRQNDNQSDSQTDGQDDHAGNRSQRQNDGPSDEGDRRPRRKATVKAVAAENSENDAPVVEAVEEQAVEAEEKPRRRGRKPGSRNKKTIAAEQDDASPDAA